MLFPRAHAVSRNSDPNLPRLGNGRNREREAQGFNSNTFPSRQGYLRAASCMENFRKRVMEFLKPLLTHPLTWCLLTMSFNFPSSLGSISGHRKMLGRDRQLFCRKKKQMGWDYREGVSDSHQGKGDGWRRFLLPAPKISQWSWTFPRCGPCVMDSGNRNAAL